MNTVRKRPILFSGEMVRAILDGRKTETRRVIKTQPPALRWNSIKWDERCIDVSDMPGRHYYVICPYGKPGDLLWVRETWRIVGWHDGEPLYLEYKDGTKLEEPGDSSDYDDDKYAQFYLDCSDDCEKAGLKIGENEEYDLQGKDAPTRWRPPIFMPRWASRITLKITNVRVERLQDISNEDILAESIPGGTGFVRDLFRNLWDSINAKPKPVYIDGVINHYVSYPFVGENETRNYRGKIWYILPNPWVWVIEFERVES